MANDAGNAAARAQIQNQAELGQAAGAPNEELGSNLAENGAAATSVDTDTLLAKLQEQLNAQAQQIAAMQKTQDAAGAAPADGVVAVAERIVSQLFHRHSALSVFSGLGDAVDKAGELLDEAKASGDSGSYDDLLTLAGSLGKRLERAANGAASADISYVQQLVDQDLPDAAVAAKKDGKNTPAKNPAPAKAPARSDTFATK